MFFAIKLYLIYVVYIIIFARLLMKKILLGFILLFLIQNLASAIDWIRIETPLNRIAYVDADSIIEYENYYFYNIKFQNPNNPNYIIMTMQSSKASPLSARLKTYSENEYNSLSGDYGNITSNIAKNLEPVTYVSVVNSCYKYVKNYMDLKKNSIILQNDEEIIE